MNPDLQQLSKKEDTEKKRLTLKLQREEAKKNAQQPNSTEIKNEAQLEPVHEDPEDEHNILN